MRLAKHTSQSYYVFIVIVAAIHITRIIVPSFTPATFQCDLKFLVTEFY